MKADQQPRPRIRIFDDPFRKLLSIVLALVLWYYLDALVTQTSTSPIKVEVTFDGKPATAQNQINVSIGSLEYSLKAIQNADTQETLEGNKISPASVGVKARTSATKSDKVTSISCPTAETTGIREAKIARTTGSSLKHHRSSILPPPRQTTSTSGGSAKALAV